MKVEIEVPIPATVTLVLRDLTMDDVNALIERLDGDRNHDARRELYQRLQDARRALHGAILED